MGEIMKIVKWIFVLALAAGCSNNSHQSHQDAVKDQQDAALRTELVERNAILVRDESGAPLASAEVLIGPSENSPFQGNVVTTNAKGEFAVPAGWTQELPVTIFKNGFIRTSYLKQTPAGQIFEVRHRKVKVRHEVKGSITGFGALPSDGFIDFGLALPSLSASEALNFDITQLISEQYDTISVMGQELDIPTNIYVPKQKESYSFIPVTVEKAFYRMFFDYLGAFKVQANRGKFDLKKVADKLKAGKSYFEVVNDFEFLALGSKNVTITPNMALDLDANQLKLTPKVDFTSAIPAKGMLFGVSMHEQDGKYLPSDIKLREAKAQKLSLPETAARGTILLVNADKEQVNKDEAKLSNSMATALVDSQKLSQGYLLERVAAPTMTSSGMKLSKPSLKGNVKGFATYAALSDVTTERLQTFNLERADISWEIYSEGWIEEIDLPDVNSVRANQRWQVVFYGVDSVDNKKFNGPKTLNQATHAVHNAVQF